MEITKKQNKCLDIDKQKAKEITQYFLDYWDIKGCSKKEIKELNKEVYFLLTTS